LKRKLFLIIILMATALQGGEHAEKQYNYAMKLYSEENYFDAITEFKRLLFFDMTRKYSYRGNMLIGQCYRMGGFYDNAIEYFNRGEMSGGDREEIYSAIIEAVKTNILRRTASRAFSLLNRLESEEYYNNKVREIHYWRGWAHLFNDEWKKGEEEFIKSGNNELARLAGETEKKFYSVTLARLLSVFIPGGGQFYAKEYLSGLLSLGWNVLTGYFTVNAFIEERVLDGFLVANFLWLRFYMGNIQNAEKFAVERNNEIKNEALRFLRDNYTGERPENFRPDFAH
jgi:TM2 domain-containing membrane protein YozV